MEKFETRFRGYDVIQVNKFIDEVISEYENLLNKSKESENKLLQSEIEVNTLKEKLEYYQSIERTLNSAMFNAESRSDEIRKRASEEASRIIEDARKHANRIINESLLKAEKINESSDRLKRNITHLKRKLRSIVEGQLDVIDELETIEYKSDDRDGFY